jgi:Flp pilus assembly protein TadD
MHLHRGHLLAAQGRLDQAVEAFRRELAHVTGSTQIHAREAEGNAWYALGAVLRRLRQHDAADAAFRRGLAVAGRHIAAAAALHGLVPTTAGPMDVALAQAIVFARAGQHGDAARVYLAAVCRQPPGWEGWMLPVEPTLDVAAHLEVWADALAVIRSRAA